MGTYCLVFWAAPRIYKFSREKKFYTQGDFVLHATDSNFAKKLTNIISIIILFGWLLVGIVGGAKVISHFGLVTYDWALIITTVIVVSYIFLAGFKAVLATDIFQAIIIFVLITLMTFIVIGDVGVIQVLKTQTGNIDIVTAAGFLLFGALALFSYANYYQLVYAAKSKKAAAIGIASSVLPIIFAGSLMLMIGMFMFLQNQGLDADLVFIEAMGTYLSPQMLSLGIVLFFAGLMSSADTNIYAITSHHVLGKSSENPVREIRRATVILGIVSIVIGYFFRDVVDVTVLAAGFSGVLSIPIIYLIAGGRNTSRFTGSVVGGITGFAIGLLIFGIEPSIFVPVVLGTLLGLIYKGKKTTQINVPLPGIEPGS